MAGFGMAAFMGIAMVAKGRLGLELMMPGMFAVASTAALVSTRLSLPKWATLRGRQMEHIGRRANELLAGAPAEDDEAPGRIETSVGTEA